ncbi:MAG: dihydrodipicolinate synthase family protein [Aggregatilineales bacterium]
MRLEGVLAAAVTPLTHDGAALASEAVFASYYRFLLQHDISGVFIGGTTGEGMVLSLAERQRICELAVALIGPHKPVLVNVGSASTAEAVTLACHAARAGANAVAVIAPYFYPLDEAAMLAHFRAVADAVPATPVYLYNLPAFTGNAITPAVVAQLRRACPNVAGMKHSDASLSRLQEFRQVGGDEFNLLSGDDSVALAALACGADGCVSGTASAFPETLLSIYAAFRQGDLARARRQQALFNALSSVLEPESGLSLTCYKAALAWRGVDVGQVRPPHRPLTPAEADKLRAGLVACREKGLPLVEPRLTLRS